MLYIILLFATILSVNVAQTINYHRAHSDNSSTAVSVLFWLAILAIIVVALLLVANVMILFWPKRSARTRSIDILHTRDVSVVMHLALVSLNLVLQIFNEMSFFCDIPT